MSLQEEPQHSAAAIAATAEKLANILNDQVESAGLSEFFETYLPQMSESVSRIGQLVKLPERLAAARNSLPTEIGELLPAGVGDDVLRSAVVLAHALLEDFLRTLANKLLPEGDSSALREIALAGTCRGKQSFQLWQLVQHKQKTVEEVIRESVSEHFEHSTFNNTSEIAQLFEKLHFNIDLVSPEFPTIDKMMRRRHQIVHRSDRAKAPGTNAYTLEPIQLEEVQSWIKSTFLLIFRIILAIPPRSIGAPVVAKSLKSE